MKVRLRLGDADRERYDCPEWMEIDPSRVSMREAVALQAGANVEGAVVAFDSPQQWRQALANDTGAGMRAVLVLVWLALRRNGKAVPLAEVDFDSDSLDYEMVPDPEDAQPVPDAEGKDESSPETTS